MAGIDFNAFAAPLMKGIIQGKKEKDAYEAQLAIAREMSQIAINKEGNPVRIDPNVKDKTLEPLVSPKALEQFNTAKSMKRAEATGRLKVLTGIGDIMLRHAISTAGSESGLKGEALKARIGQSQSRDQLNQVQIAQQLGLIPKVTPPPTGGQIVAEQRAQRRERFTQRKEIADQLITQGVLDPGILLDEGAIKYGSTGAGGWVDKSRDEASLAQIEGMDKPVPIRTFKQMQEGAKKWHQLGTAQKPTLTVPPAAAQKLISNPTPELRAFFDAKYGQGAADTIINAQSPETEEPNATPPADEPEDEEDGG